VTGLVKHPELLSSVVEFQNREADFLASDRAEAESRRSQNTPLDELVEIARPTAAPRERATTAISRTIHRAIGASNVEATQAANATTTTTMSPSTDRPRFPVRPQQRMLARERYCWLSG
jgi:hypothetical protein